MHIKHYFSNSVNRKQSLATEFYKARTTYHFKSTQNNFCETSEVTYQIAMVSYTQRLKNMSNSYDCWSKKCILNWDVTVSLLEATS